MKILIRGEGAYTYNNLTVHMFVFFTCFQKRGGC